MEDNFDEVVREVAGMPIYDAAYKLWKSRRKYSELQVPPTIPKPPPGESADWNSVRHVVRGVMTAVNHERVAAPDSRIFEILQAAHPEVAATDLKTVIQIAVDFDGTCVRSFEYSQGGDLHRDVERAIEAAKAAYPQFQETTYRLASFFLMTAMR